MSFQEKEILSVGKILNDESRPLKERFRALFTLKNIGGPLAIEQIKKGFSDPSALLKHELAYCLGQMQDSSAIPVLVDVLKDKTQEPMVRHEAGEALGAIGDTSVIPLLDEYSNDSTVEVAETCELALKRLKWIENAKATDQNLSENPYASVDPAPPDIGKYVETTFEGCDKKLPVMCIGITSGIGRLVFGYVADLPKVNRILLQQISFLSIGILTMMLSFIQSYSILLVISLAMGLFDGCFISLLGPIAFDICGQKDAAQAIGFLLGMCSIPLTVGPPIAGLIYDHTGSYHLPFLLAGIPPIFGALAMCLVYRVNDETTDRPDDELGPDAESLTDPKRQNVPKVNVKEKKKREDLTAEPTNQLSSEAK